jgi:hypothetical protein
VKVAKTFYGVVRYFYNHSYENLEFGVLWQSIIANSADFRLFSSVNASYSCNNLHYGRNYTITIVRATAQVANHRLRSTYYQNQIKVITYAVTLGAFFSPYNYHSCSTSHSLV